MDSYIEGIDDTDHPAGKSGYEVCERCKEYIPVRFIGKKKVCRECGEVIPILIDKE